MPSAGEEIDKPVVYRVRVIVMLDGTVYIATAATALPALKIARSRAHLCQNGLSMVETSKTSTVWGIGRGIPSPTDYRRSGRAS